MTEVLIIGAGPTGLVLALWLTKFGVSVRIVDKAKEPGTTSRALAVQARTLEEYRTLGIDEEVLRHGLVDEALSLWSNGQHRARVALGAIGQGLSPFPFVLTYPQDAHEKMLTRKLEEAGVRVERPVEITALEQDADRVRVRLRHEDGREENTEAAFVAGCDGARSFVRQALGIGFPGGTYENLYYVADTEVSGAGMKDPINIAFERGGDFVISFLLGDGRVRFVGALRQTGKDDLTWDDVSPITRQRIHIDVTKVNWFSSYRVHHRVAEKFHIGRAFLLGDAGHIHSPVGGQGMNTGIGDAINLAWKLAHVVQNKADLPLLDTYHEERHPFAERLVHTTDAAFELVASDSSFAQYLRTSVFPRLVNFALHFKKAREFLFRTVSQIAINYRASRLSEGAVGKVQGGDRLPWNGDKNFDPLSSRDWQVHVYGTAPKIETTLPVHTFAGKDNAIYLLRPDGYIALATREPKDIEAYFARHGIRHG